MVGQGVGEGAIKVTFTYAYNIVVNKNSKRFPNQPGLLAEKPAREDNLSGSTIYKAVQRPHLLRKVFQQVSGFQRRGARHH